MLLCFCPCHVPHFVVMSRLSPATGISSRLHCSVDWSSDGRLLPFGFGFRRNDVPFKRRLRFVIRAQLSEAFSPDLGLDSQVNLLLSTSFFMQVDRFLLTSFAYMDLYNFCCCKADLIFLTIFRLSNHVMRLTDDQSCLLGY